MGIVVRAALVASALLTASAIATAAPVEISPRALALIADRAILDTVSTTANSGTTGVHISLDKCYARLARSHSSRAAAYCIYEDRWATMTSLAVFPNADDPYFNTRSFTARAIRALNLTSSPGISQNEFLQTMLEVQNTESKKVGTLVLGSSAEPTAGR